MSNYLKSAISHRWDSTNMRKITLTVGVDLYMNMTIDDSAVPTVPIDGNIIVDLEINEDSTTARGNIQKTKYFEYPFSLVQDWDVYKDHITLVTLSNPDGAAEKETIETKDAPSY